MPTVEPRPKAKKTKKPARKNYSAQCDKLFSEWVRSVGMCESGRLDHKGSLQCAHGFSRRYRAIRWDRGNAWCLCAGCHKFYTEHPIEWDLWLQSYWGEIMYHDMRTKALSGVRPNLKALRDRLAVEVARHAA